MGDRAMASEIASVADTDAGGETPKDTRRE